MSYVLHNHKIKTKDHYGRKNLISQGSKQSTKSTFFIMDILFLDDRNRHFESNSLLLFTRSKMLNLFILMQ